MPVDAEMTELQEYIAKDINTHCDNAHEVNKYQQILA